MKLSEYLTIRGVKAISKQEAIGFSLPDVNSGWWKRYADYEVSDEALERIVRKALTNKAIKRGIKSRLSRLVLKENYVPPPADPIRPKGHKKTKDVKQIQRKIKLAKELTLIESRQEFKEGLQSKKTPDVEFFNSKEWKSLRYQAIQYYGNMCQCCGRSPKHGVIIHVDHIKPRQYYPWLELCFDNLQVLCDDCNLGKSSAYINDWR